MTSRERSKHMPVVQRLFVTGVLVTLALAMLSYCVHAGPPQESQDLPSVSGRHNH